MGEDGKVIYKVVIDDSGVENEAEAAGQKAGGGVERGAKSGTNAFEQMMIGAARRIGEAFVNMAQKAVQGVEQIARAGVEFNAKMEQYQTAFTTLLGDADAAASAMERIREDAARTPFDVDSLTQANQMLISAGLSADKARNDVLNLANAIAATGGGSAELSRMAANMQQIQNTGKATAMDIRQFANAGINIYGLLADSMGVTTAEAAEMDVTYEQLAAALQHAADAGGMYEGAMEAQSKTFTGRLSTLKDNITQLEGALTQDLFSQLSNTALPMVMDWVATLLDAAETGGIEGAIKAAKGILGGLVKKFGDFLKSDSLPKMMDAGVELLVGLLDGISSSGAIMQIIAAIGIVIRALLNAIINHLPEILGAGVSILMQLLTGIASMIPTLLNMAGEIILGLFNSFVNADWKSIGTNIIQGIANGISGLWGWLVDEVSQGVTRLWESAKKALGIASPSKKFAYIGEMSVEGTMEGFEDNEQEMTRVVHDIYSGLPETANDALRPFDVNYTGNARENIERDVSFNMTASGRMADMTIVVPLTLDGREIARATAWSMGEQLAWEEL